MSVFKSFGCGLVAVVIALSLVACAGPARRAAETRQALERAAQLSAQGELGQAAAIYWEVAPTQASPERETLQLKALETVVTPATRDAAKSYLTRIDETAFNDELLVRKRIAEARLALLYEQPLVALRALAPALDSAAPSRVSELQHLRAQAQLAAGQTLQSVTTRMALAKRLIEPTAKATNAQAIWEALNRESSQQLYQWRTQASDRELQGWLELAYLSKTAPAELDAVQQGLDEWQSRFPQHPASARFISEVLEDWRSLRLEAKEVAVLLALTGKYAVVADAVMTGIIAAVYTNEAGGDIPRVRVYDVGDDPQSVPANYMRAVREGADAVIGPLNKQSVNQMARLSELPVPVLTLNYVEANTTTPADLYQFGLLPEDEARQAAERATLEGRTRAIVFVPEGVWGKRLGMAFKERFEALGGSVLAAQQYPSGETDFSVPIKRALALDQSERRYRALKKTLRRELKFEPRRRHDVDMVFIAALPRQAKLLQPQFKFYFAGDLAVYATSHIYSGIEDAVNDRDLDGIRYCDMPWTLSADSASTSLKARVEKLFGGSSHQLPRLTALGIDAFNLLPLLRRLVARPYERHAGLTGNISIDGQRRAHRQLNWARFQGGRPRLLQALDFAGTEP